MRQIMISISDSLYDRLINMDIDSDTCSFNESALVEAIQKGTPLPKGHGKLIDADKIEWYGCDFEGCSTCIKVDRNCNVCPHARCYADQVRNLPIIIEADKEDNE